MTPITLSEALKMGDKDVTKINLRKPTAGEMRGLSLADVGMLDVDTLITLIPRITQPSISEAQAETLPFDDIMALGRAIAQPSKVGNDTTLKP